MICAYIDFLFFSSLASVPTNLKTLRCFNVHSFDSLPDLYVSDGESLKNISYINAQLSQPLKKLHNVEPGELCALG